ncbi:hypothetical protein PC9H_009842 [Pleurotus ostreatus]|uniref:Uncharacterized protein n=2 Tax=Pleurotus TaxID=5320 RepID=A0A8H6ZUH9_PLEOS|nr:uncharacterized protein PC9H_009842 [Pleurotus ostreatus]KAF7424535.1 hypothetical protein PC9H_009842 [Pleurotus ostreatus]KAG9224961.1 hypothetical protein CCMSSC00406_0001888 [Pleurotus cornucopiae]KAJ8692512.1 hypothetical protein PTI98_009817 [Pleurotus ostreatus]
MNSLITARGPDSIQGAGSPASSPLIAAFNGVQLTGLVLLLAVVLTAWLAPTVKRSPAWYNVIISWIFSSSSFLLLMGRQAGPSPPFGLCLVQSMFIYAAPAMNACVCLCFALELFFSVFGATTQTRTSFKWKFLIVSLPYVTTFLVCLEVLTIGLINRNLVERNAIGMYCHLSISAPSIVTGVIVIFVMISVLPVVAVVIFMFIRNWSNFRTLCAEENGGVPRRMMIRFGIFCILPLPIVTISLVSWQFSDRSPSAAPLAIVIATLPIMIALIFGTQWDILHVWMFWKRHPHPVYPMSPVKPLAAPLSREEIELDIKPSLSNV